MRQPGAVSLIGGNLKCPSLLNPSKKFGLNSFQVMVVFPTQKKKFGLGSLSGFGREMENKKREDKEKT